MSADPPDTFEERVRCCLRCHVEAHALGEPKVEAEVRDSLNEALWAALLSLSVSARVLIQKIRPEAK